MTDKITIERATVELALEVLEKLNNTNSYWWQEVDKELVEQLGGAESTIREALAEQPAQQCKWPTCQSEEYQQALAEQIMRELVGEHPAQPQQKPVAFDVVCDDCGGNGLDQHNQNYHCAACNGLGYTEKRLYTSPPASKPWVGLTDDQIINVAKSIDVEFKDEGLAEQVDDILTFARAIEAAHQIKGAHD